MRTVYYPPGGGDPLYSLPSSWGNVAGITLDNCEELGWVIGEEETPLEIREIEYTAAVDSLFSTTAVDRGYASTEQLLSFANSTVPKQWVDAHDFIAWRDAVLAALAEFLDDCRNMTIYPWPDYGEMLNTLPGFSWSDGPYVIPENVTVPDPVDSAVAMHHLSSQDAPSRGFYTSTELTIYGHSIKDYQNSSPWRRATMGPYEWPWEPPYMLGLAEDGEAVTVSGPVIGFARIMDREDALDLAFQICLPFMPATYPSLEGTGTPIEGEYTNAPVYIWRLMEVDLWGNHSFPEEHAPSTRMLRTLYEDSEYYTGTDDYLVWADRILGKWVLCQISVMTAEEWTGYDNYEGHPPWPDCDPGPFPRYSFEQIAGNRHSGTVLGFFPPYFNNLEQFSSDYNQNPDNPAGRDIHWSVSNGVATARASIGTSAWSQLSGGSSTVPVTAFYGAVADEAKHPWVARWTPRLPSGASTALVDLVPQVASRLGKLSAERLYQRDGIPLRIAVPSGATSIRVSSVDVIPTTSAGSPSVVSLGEGVSALKYETTVHASTAFGETSGLAFLRYYNAAGDSVDTLQEASYLTFSLDEVNPLSDTVYVQWQDGDLDWGDWKPVSVHAPAAAAGETVSGEPVSGEYTAGTGISINGTVIALDTSGAIAGYVLRKAVSGVEWAEAGTVTTEAVQDALSIDPDTGDTTKVLTEKGTFVDLPSGGGADANLSDADPLSLGTAAPGEDTNAARADHVHPTTGLATLDGGGKVPLGQLPEIDTGPDISTAIPLALASSGLSGTDTDAAAADHVHPNTGLVLATEKGTANGVATLDETGKIPIAQIPDGTGTGGVAGIEHAIINAPNPVDYSTSYHLEVQVSSSASFTSPTTIIDTYTNAADRPKAKTGYGTYADFPAHGITRYIRMTNVLLDMSSVTEASYVRHRWVKCALGMHLSVSGGTYPGTYIHTSGAGDSAIFTTSPNSCSIRNVGGYWYLIFHEDMGDGEIVDTYCYRASSLSGTWVSSWEWSLEYGGGLGGTAPTVTINVSYANQVRDLAWNTWYFPCASVFDNYYAASLGDLVVYITGATGGQWSVNSTNWHDSGDYLSLPAGTYTVTFSAQSGYTTPEPQDAVVINDGTVIINAAYAPL